MELMHKWENRGYTPPYRCLGVASIPSPALAEANPLAYSRALSELPKGFACGSCSICGTPLVHNFLMIDANGSRFTVGSDCVKKSGDAQLVSAIEKERLAFNRAKAKAKRDAIRAAAHSAYEAELEAQRARNNGLTDYEVEQHEKAESHTQLCKARADANEWIVNALPHCWMADTLYELREGNVALRDLSRGTLYLLAKEYGKLAGRTKSKAWQAKFDEFWEVAGISRTFE